ncbi:hypothetical protein BH10ACT1_BH10ACT1_30470 [soil metagenome]
MADDPLDPAAETEADDTEASVEEPAEVVDGPVEAESKAVEGKAKAKATPVKPEGTVVRKKVTSKRVTPKGAPQGVKTTPPKGSTPARTKSADGEDLGFSQRYTAPEPTYAPGPSPWWVPAIMFGLLIVGALIIMLNYMGVFGDAENIRLVIGLAFILGGIIAATQYR